MEKETWFRFQLSNDQIDLDERPFHVVLGLRADAMEQIIAEYEGRKQPEEGRKPSDTRGA